MPNFGLWHSCRKWATYYANSLHVSSTYEVDLFLLGKFWNVLLEKDGGRLDTPGEKWRNITWKHEEEEYPMCTERVKANLCHILCRNCLLRIQRLIEGTMYGSVKVMGRRGVNYWMTSLTRLDNWNWNKEH
jgi:hypothetical protein